MTHKNILVSYLNANVLDLYFLPFSVFLPCVSLVDLIPIVQTPPTLLAPLPRPPRAHSSARHGGAHEQSPGRSVLPGEVWVDVSLSGSASGPAKAIGWL